MSHVKLSLYIQHSVRMKRIDEHKKALALSGNNAGMEEGTHGNY